jgi:hypothetical protein
METYTIRPRAGAYRVEATATDGRCRLVAAYPTEEAAVALLRRLQKAGIDQPKQRRLRDWRA